MKRALNVILLAFISVVFGSCDKNVFSNGAVTEKNDTLPEAFQIVEFRDNVNVMLKHCDEEHFSRLVHIKTAENLIDDIKTEIVPEVVTANDGHDTLKLNRLIISNENTYNYLRPYDYPLEVTVYYDSIYGIFFYSNGIVETDTIKGIAFPHSTSVDDSVKGHSKYNTQITVLGGSGDLHLLLSGNEFSVMKTNYVNGTVDIFAEGNTGYAETKTDYNCHGLIDYSELEIHKHNILHRGTNRIYTRVFSTITANNVNNGEIYYIRYKKKTFDCLPADDEHPWAYYDSVVHFCPHAKQLTGEGIYSIDRY